MKKEEFEKLSNSIKNRIQSFKIRLDAYLAMGNDIYAVNKKKLPFYYQGRGICKSIEEETGRKREVDELLEFCGVPYDRDFKDFKEFEEKLKPYTNGDVVAFPPRIDGKMDPTYSKIKTYGMRYDCNLFDFLYLTTGLKLSGGTIQGDYIENLSLDMFDVYPDGDITNIKRDNPKLYNRLRHLKRYLPEDLTSNEILDILGARAESFNRHFEKGQINEKEILSQLKKLYPDRIVKDLQKEHRQLYIKVVKIAVSQDKTVKQWLECHGFSYPNATDIPRLSRTQADATKRAKFLQSLKDEKLKGIDLEKLGEREKFHLNIKILEEILDENDLHLGKRRSKLRKEANNH